MTDDASNPALHFGRELRRARLAAGMTLAQFGRSSATTRARSRALSAASARPPRSSRRCATRLSRPRRLVSALLPGQPAVVRDPAVVPQLDRARAARGQPADLAAVLAVRAAANRGVRARAAADLPRRDRPSRSPSGSPRGWPARRSSPARHPPRRWCWFLVDEAALRRRTGSALIMADQLEHLLTLAALPNVTIQVVPNVAHAELTGGFAHRGKAEGHRRRILKPR